jgi:HxlR-like helix-turn-helix
VSLLTVTDDAACSYCEHEALRGGLSVRIWTARSQQRHISGCVESPATRLLLPRPASILTIKFRVQSRQFEGSAKSEFSAVSSEDPFDSASCTGCSRKHPKKIAQRLRELERDGLIIRTDLNGRLRHVEYALSDSGGLAVMQFNKP